MRIKIGVINESINMLDHFVALDGGLYKDEGLDVELVLHMRRDTLKWLDSGEVLLSSATPRVVESIMLERSPYQFVLLTRRNPPHYIVSRPGIKTAKELKGKTLWGSAAGSTNYYMMIDWLKKHGLNPGTDVMLTSVEQRREVVFSGNVPEWATLAMKMTCDAMMAVPPEAEWLVEEAGYHYLVELCEEWPDRMIHGLAAHPDIIKREADLVRRAVRAHVRTAQTIAQDKETTAALMMKRWGLNRTAAENIWQKMRGCFMADVKPSWLDLELDYFQQQLRRSFPQREIHRPDPASLIDASFL